MTRVYLAMINPEHETAVVLGVFSELEPAQMVFGEGTWAVQRPPRRAPEWWMLSPYSLAYTDNIVRELIVDQAVRA